MTILTNEDVEEIVRILDASVYGDLRLKTKTFELTLRRGESGWTQERRDLKAAEVIGAAAAPQGPIAAKAETDEIEGRIAIRAPSVGIFYRAPKPGAPPFVEIGSSVDENTIIGIVEAMKLMTSVPAGAKGIVTDILAENGKLIDARQVLVRLRPHA